MTPSNKSKTKPKPSGNIPTSWEFEAIGTHWWIGVFDSLSKDQLSIVKRAVADRIEEFDKTYSRFRNDSLIAKISKRAGEYTFPADFRTMITFYRQLYDATAGAVTPLIGNMLVAAGYDAAYSLHPKKLKQVPAWDDVLSYSGDLLTIKQPVTLDFGAAGKGYLVDIVAGILKSNGVGDFCVDAGGDVLTTGAESMRIGLEHPDDPAQVIGVAQLNNQTVAGSGRNRRKWADFHHIMDPQTLRSTSGLKAAWVVAETCMLADGLTTALFFIPPEKLQQFDFEYLLINDNNNYRQSAGFPAELF